MKRKNMGIALIVTPIPLLFMTLAAYAIVSFVIASMITATGGGVIAGQIIRALLGLVGVVAVVGIIFGMPLGIYLLVTADRAEQDALQPPSMMPPQPPTV